MSLATLIIMKQFFFFGVLMAIWLAVSSILMPMWRAFRQLFTDTQIQARRGRSYTITALCTVLVIGLVGWLPLPDSTNTEGVVWMPPSAQLRAPMNGVIARVTVADGALVTPGTPLLYLENYEQTRRLAMLDAQMDEYTAKTEEGRVR